MKYTLLIYPSGSEDALGERESKSVSAEYLAFRDDPRCLVGLICSRSRRLPRSPQQWPEPDH